MFKYLFIILFPFLIFCIWRTHRDYISGRVWTRKGHIERDKAPVTFWFYMIVEILMLIIILSIGLSSFLRLIIRK
ncbi:MAG TPA: hypothetical protein DET40_21970 [Lentisphaeria bacterium]|nr:MAG: hypothetical protein A2X45_04060 [Lentisphaerae bacterium GWF2_50_93]HCE46221.1 hypothetical protein [Lentisphaeria bacterium]